jgi:hypothetical protein
VAASLYSGENPVDSWSPSPGTPRRDLLYDGERGVVTTIDSRGLVRWAAQRGCVVVLDLALGDVVVNDERIGAVWGGDPDADPTPAAGFLRVEQSRTPMCDIGHGVRQLTDIADRALSPGINDPTTAIQVVDELYAVLRPLAGRRDLSPYLLDDDGTVRALYRAQTFDGLVDTSLAEIAYYGKDSPRILDLVRDVATRLLVVAADMARTPTRRTLERLCTSSGDGPAMKPGSRDRDSVMAPQEAGCPGRVGPPGPPTRAGRGPPRLGPLNSDPPQAGGGHCGVHELVIDANGGHLSRSRSASHELSSDDSVLGPHCAGHRTLRPVGRGRVRTGIVTDAGGVRQAAGHGCTLRGARLIGVSQADRSVPELGKARIGG